MLIVKKYLSNGPESLGSKSGTKSFVRGHSVPQMEMGLMKSTKSDNMLVVSSNQLSLKS